MQKISTETFHRNTSLPNFQNLYNIVLQFGPRLSLINNKIKIYDPEIICCIVKSTRPERNWLRNCSMISLLLIKPPSCHFYYMAFLKNNFHYRKTLGPWITQKTEQKKIQCCLDSCALNLRKDLTLLLKTLVMQSYKYITIEIKRFTDRFPEIYIKKFSSHTSASSFLRCVAVMSA